MAPEAPSSTRTSLLHTGQPTAKKVSRPPTAPVRLPSPAVDRSPRWGWRTYMLNVTPASTAVTDNAG